MATAPTPLPQPNFPWIDPKTGRPVQAFSLYMASLDAAVRALVVQVNELQAKVK